MNKENPTSSVGPLQAGSATGSIRVGIIGHVGNQNLGDESIIAAVIQNVRCRCPDAEIFGFTIVPSDTDARHGIPSFPIRRLSQSNGTAPSPNGASSSISARNRSAVQRAKDLIKIIPFLGALMRRTQRALESIPKIIKEISFLRQSREHVKDLDLLIFAGSHQLNDFVGGPWSFPYTVLKWTLLAKGAGARVVFLSLGAGPIDSWLGRSFILRALKNACYRSYRDVTAKRVIDGLHLFPADKVVPDLAFSLDSPVASNDVSSVGRPVVGINPMPLYTDYWHETDFAKYQNYVGKLASFADGLVDRGHEVHFIPTQLRVDPPVITDIRKQMSTNGDGSYKDFIVEPATQTLDQLRSALGNVDIMVATRYHGILLSLALEKPVLAVAYHSKSRDLMEWLGLGEYVIDGDGFTPVALAEMISSLERNRDVVAASLRERLPGFRSAVQAQYDEVMELVARSGGVR